MIFASQINIEVFAEAESHVIVRKSFARMSKSQLEAERNEE